MKICEKGFHFPLRINPHNCFTLKYDTKLKIVLQRRDTKGKIGVCPSTRESLSNQSDFRQSRKEVLKLATRMFFLYRTAFLFC